MKEITIKPLTRNERVLSAVLIVLVLCAVFIFGGKWMLQEQNNLSLQVSVLKGDQDEARVQLQAIDLWNARRAWILAHEPVLQDAGNAEAKLLQEVLRAAREQTLTVRNQSLGEPAESAQGFRVGVDVEVKGSMQGICRWLVQFQDPEKCYALTQLTLKADEDQKSMICTVHIIHCYRKV